ncbi:MAG TPA: hypothetical protein VGO84_04150, partial [Burkholderiales bacterium]|nr:hypothetical protein [Burkholderiales bacterium]
MFAARLLQLQRLHITGDFLLQLVARFLVRAEVLFGHRQLHRRFIRGHAASFCLSLSARGFLLPFIAARVLRLQLAFALRELALQRGQLVADALTILTHVLQLLLHPREFRVRFVEAA